MTDKPTEGTIPWPALAPWAAAAALMTVYFLTMCRDLYWYDSAELAMAAIQPGLSHPPGQPLHTLIGWLMSHVVPGHPLLGVNMLSALCAALTAVPALRIAVKLNPLTRNRGVWMAAAVIVGLGCNDAIWDSATRVEVYAPAGLLSLLTLDLIMGTISAIREGRTRGKRFLVRWFGLGLLLGLTFSVHPYIAIFMSIACVVAAGWLLATTKLPAPASCAGVFMAGGIVGILPYAWLPLSALGTENLVWGDPSSWDGIVFYVTGMDYAHNRAGLGGTIAHSMHFLGWMMRQGLLPVILGGLLAWWLGLKMQPGKGVRAVPVVLMVLGLVVIGRIDNYRPDIPDFMGYLLPATWLAGVGLAAAAARAYAVVPKRWLRLSVAGLVVIWTAMNALMAPSLPDRSRADSKVARGLAEGFLIDAPEDAIILVDSDHVLFPLLYVTEVEGQREDVVILNRGWASSSWYWDHLYSIHPTLSRFDLEAANREERIRKFLEANADRPVVAENLGLASLSTGPILRLGWTLRTGAGASEIDPMPGVRMHQLVRARLNRWIENHGHRGTQDRKILAWIATQWGHDERRGGMPAQAVLDYLSSATTVAPADFALPSSLFKPDSWPDEVTAPPGTHPFRLLSTPELNLFHAGELLDQNIGAGETGEQLIEHASSLGCVEAYRWLQEEHP